MSTSDTKKGIFVTLSFTIFALIINYVYGFFGHGVSSDYMTYLFAIPLFGTFIYTIFYLIKKRKLNRVGFNMFNSGLTILGVGSLIKGVYEIAGTASIYEYVYLILGLLVTVIGFMILVFKK